MEDSKESKNSDLFCAAPKHRVLANGMNWMNVEDLQWFPCEVYGISIDGEPHSFVVNGIVCHDDSEDSGNGKVV
jgi:hypothetical protein